jgi:hypothetical protein
LVRSTASTLFIVIPNNFLNFLDYTWTRTCPPDRTAVPHPESEWRKLPITIGQEMIKLEILIPVGLKPTRKGQMT